jgi:hypothetical protein
MEDDSFDNEVDDGGSISSEDEAMSDEIQDADDQQGGEDDEVLADADDASSSGGSDDDDDSDKESVDDEAMRQKILFAEAQVCFDTRFHFRGDLNALKFLDSRCSLKQIQQMQQHTLI